MTNRQLRTTLNLPLYRRLISSNWYSYQLNKKRYCGSNPKMKRAILQVFLMIVVIFVWNGVIDQLQDYQVDIRHGVMVSGAVPVATAYVRQVSEAESQVSAQDTGMTIEEQIRKIAKDFKDVDVLVKIATCESSLNPKATNGTSSATGLFQYLKGTWEEAVKIRGLDWTLEDRTNIEKSTDMIMWHIERGNLSKWDESKNCWNK